MPRLPLGLAPARQRHGDTAPQLASGWCLPCYEAGVFTPALGDQLECAFHNGLTDTQTTAVATSVRPSPCSRPPHGSAGRASSRPSAPFRSARRALHHSTARALAYGRRRAAARVNTGSYQPHPGWRHFIETGWRVLIDQAEALRIVEDLVDAQDWRADKRTSWLAILRRLVYSMDWSTGLVTAVTAQRLGAAGDRAPRTVSRVLAWARDAGLIVVVEQAASAEFLGSQHGRTPTYALVTDTPLPRCPTGGDTSANCDQSESSTRAHTQFTGSVEESGDLPTSSVDIEPSNGTRLNNTRHQPTPWLAFRVPESPTERNLATQCLLQRLGLDRRVFRVPLWRTRALLRPWWEAGASPVGLLYAIDHHPDHPHHHRGDALRGAHDPLRVLGHRLQPWRDRLSELPPTVRGIHGDYQHKPATASPTAHPHARAKTDYPSARAEVRQAARAALDEHLRLLRQRRAKSPIVNEAAASRTRRLRAHR
ncbi:MAG: hypothetical protein JO309_12660 [Pseudonocardiales bacterium]|nr:hypothetical protein [Pseudonocardiales bacterium]